MPASRILVVADRTCPCPGLHEHLRRAAPAAVHVVAPALNGRAAHFVSDTDRAVRAAMERLGALVGLLGRAGIDATGEVGDARPIVAIDDALAEFRATELLLSTWPAGRSHWLERGLLAAVARFELPVTHLASPYDLDPLAADGAVAVSLQPAA